jgi:hypothetical protein
VAERSFEGRVDGDLRKSSAGRARGSSGAFRVGIAQQFGIAIGQTLLHEPQFLVSVRRLALQPVPSQLSVPAAQEDLQALLTHIAV